MKVRITLNGTGENPNLRLGLTQNPFPAIPDARFHIANRIIADLDAEPIPSVEALKVRLAGCGQEFVDACVAEYKPGQRVSFFITFPSEE